MKISNIALTLGLLTASALVAQPLQDKITVTLPYAVHVNDNTVLPPGDYTIRQHDSVAGGSRIVHFFSDKGMKFETTAMGIAALDNKTPEDTRLELEQFGKDYYLNKIWVQGKNYGYEFPIPDSVKNRENERNASTSSVSARYETDASSSAASSAPATVAAAEPAPTPAPVAVEPAPVPVPVEAAPVAEAAPVQAEPVQVAQADTRPVPEVTSSTASTTASSASSEPAMPSTASNWPALMLAGGLLVGTGMILRLARA